MRVIDARVCGTPSAFSALLALPGTAHPAVVPTIVSLAIAAVLLLRPLAAPRWLLSTLTGLAAASTALAVGGCIDSGLPAGPLVFVLLIVHVSALRGRTQAWVHLITMMAVYACVLRTRPVPSGAAGPWTVTWLAPALSLALLILVIT